MKDLRGKNSYIARVVNQTDGHYGKYIYGNRLSNTRPILFLHRPRRVFFHSGRQPFRFPLHTGIRCLTYVRLVTRPSVAPCRVVPESTAEHRTHTISPFYWIPFCPRIVCSYLMPSIWRRSCLAISISDSRRSWQMNSVCHSRVRFLTSYGIHSGRYICLSVNSMAFYSLIRVLSSSVLLFVFQ